LGEQVLGLLRSSVEPGERVVEQVDALVDGLDDLLRAEGFKIGTL
jgi:hypothetical protein